MISIIIPTSNEEKTIGTLLESLSSEPECEVIVVDGGSSDKTIEIAQGFPCRILHCEKQRSLQMNQGARAAHGDILVFLHADCMVEPGGPAAIRRALTHGALGGCLTQRLDSGTIIYRFIEFSGNIRARLLRIFYGDQALFVRRDTFFALGGFDSVEIFEDILFSLKLRRTGKTVVLAHKVTTSVRRWQHKGIVKTTLMNWVLSVGFALRLPYASMKKLYTDIR